MSGSALTAYEQGYQAGFRDFTAPGVGEQKAVVLELAERQGTPLLSPEDESNYWLGFYHGRHAARTARSPFVRN
jgi:hypothetical protein